MPQTATAFDALAGKYDSVWSDTAVGTYQRLAVWRRIDPLFFKDDLVLDIGCGTGVDACHLQSKGVEVYGIDSSSAMVDQARSRGVNAHHHPIEQLASLHFIFDGAISNFGPLNCVRSLKSTALTLAARVRSGGYFALCVMGRFCLWETAYFLAKCEVRKAFRRFSNQPTASLGIDVFYPSKASILSAFSPHFQLVDQCGIGLFISPSYVRSLSDKAVERLAVIDSRIAHWPILRSLSDHRLYIFRRL